MNNLSIENLETKRLILKKPTMDEQFTLWSILKDAKVNRYYFPTPDRIFAENNLNKDKIDDLKKARNIFQKYFGDWEKQKSFYENKILSIKYEDNRDKFTWSVFLKNGQLIGQITLHPKAEYPENPEIRGIAWYINPEYQGQGYGTEAAEAVLKFMFEKVNICKIITTVATANKSSIRILEKLGFERTGIKESTYYDDYGNILKCYFYTIDKNMFMKNTQYKTEVKQ